MWSVHELTRQISVKGNSTSLPYCVTLKELTDKFMKKLSERIYLSSQESLVRILEEDLTILEKNRFYLNGALVK